MAGRMTIQRYPRALLDWLGMKGNGDTPHELREELQSTMEIGYLFLQDRLISQLANTVNVSVNGWIDSAGGGTVPDGEMWIVVSTTWSRTSALPAGTGWTVWGGVRRRYNGTYFVMNPTPVVIPVAGLGATGMSYTPGQFIMQSGDYPACYVSAGVFATPSPMTFSMEYYRLTI